jgi:hypothetical protein
LHDVPIFIHGVYGRLAPLAAGAAELARAPDYLDDEREFVSRLAAFVDAQATRLARLAHEAATIPAAVL